MPMIDNYGRGPGEMDIVASHQRALISACLRTEGPILELGVGWYSTPILHEIATVQKRTLLTVDNIQHWYAQFAGLGNKYHKFHLIGWWGDLIRDLDGIRPEMRWSVAFIDNGPPDAREHVIRQLLPRVDVFVLHDTEEGHAYGYNRMLGRQPKESTVEFDRSQSKFRSQITDQCQEAWTTIASNDVDVEQWNLPFLPPVRPSAEIT